MKVLIPLTYAELGGGQRFLLNLIEELSLKGIDFEVWLYESGLMETELKKRHIKFRLFSKVTSFFGLITFIREIYKCKPDIIYLHATRVISLIAYFIKIPCIERINMSRGFEAGGWCRYVWIDRFFTNLNTKNIAVSDSIAKELLDRGVFKHKIITIKNYVDVDRFSDLSQRDKIRMDLGVSTNQTMVLNIGRMVQQKNQQLFIRIAKEITYKYANVIFVLIGEGPLYSFLQVELSKYELQDKIRILPFQDNIQDYYAAADILLHTPLWEPLANVLLEAWCSGLSIVATDVEGNREVGPGIHLFDKDDIQTAIKYILKLKDEPRKLPRTVEKKEQVLNSYLTLFNSVNT